MKTLFSTIVVLFALTSTFSQTSELGVFLGGGVYNGDIDVTPSNFLQQTRPAYGIFGAYHFDGTWAARVQIYHSELYADERKYPSSNYRFDRGFSFHTPLTELALIGEWSPIRLGNVYLYGFGGAALTNFTPTTNFNQTPSDGSVGNPAVVADQLEQKNHTTLAIPIGGGVKWIMSSRFVLGAEVGGRKTFSDYIDGISQAASPKSKDFYFFGGLNFSFLFGHNKNGNGFSYRGGVSCPHF